MQLNELKKEKVIAKMQEIEQIVAKLPDDISVHDIDLCTYFHKTSILVFANINGEDYMPYVREKLGINADIAYKQDDEGYVHMTLPVVEDIVLAGCFKPVKDDG